MFYVTDVSVDKIILVSSGSMIINNELNRILDDVTVAYFMVLSRYLLGSGKKNTKTENSLFPGLVLN